MELDNRELRRWLYHRPPFLLLDRILELEPKKRAVGVKCVSCLDPYFAGHFPHEPIFPGVLVVEALAQLAAVAEGYAAGGGGGDGAGPKPPMGYLAQIKEFRFRRMVRPGDVLELEVVFERRFGSIVRCRAEARVAGEAVAEGILLFSVEPVE